MKFFLVFLFYLNTAFAQGDRIFTLEQLFLTHEFKSKTPLGLKFLPSGGGYTFLKENSTTQTYDLWKHDIKTNTNAILVSASQLKLFDSEKLYSIDEYSITNDLSKIIFTSTLPSRGIKTGGEIYLFDLTKKEFKSLTPSSETQSLVQVSPDGNKPAHFDPSQKYPVLMYAYGGPGSQTVLDRWTKNDFWFHYLSQQGYVVVCVDNRGTGGRGKVFKSSTYKNLGALESTDQAEAARYLSQQPWVDPTRIGIWGWSYGGYLSALSACKYKEFKAAISVAPVSDWRYYDSIYTERYMGTPKENPQGYQNASLLTHAATLSGSLLVIHGTGDDNVHFQNSLSFVDELIANNKKVDVMYYPNRTHGIYEGPYTRYHLYTKMTDFLLKNL